MKLRLLACLSLLALSVCVVSAPAQAQVSKFDVFGGYSYSTNSFGCGDFGFGCDESTGLNGYALSAVYNFNNHIGLEGNFSGHNGASTLYSYQPTSTDNGESDVVGEDIYTYTFGPKISLPMGNFTLFTHFLVGATHVHESYRDTCLQSGGEYSCFSTDTGRGSANGMAFRTGGGVDWNRGRWGIRILEVDYVHSQLSGTAYYTEGSTIEQPETGTDSMNTFELATGVTFHFGMR